MELTHTDYSVAIIGAGVVGLTTALILAEAGKQVAVIDRKGQVLEAGFGHAGAPGLAEPMSPAAPGLIRKAIKWFFDPVGPLSIPRQFPDSYRALADSPVARLVRDIVLNQPTAMPLAPYRPERFSKH